MFVMFRLVERVNDNFQGVGIEHKTLMAKTVFSHSFNYFLENVLIIFTNWLKHHIYIRLLSRDTQLP